MNSDTTDTDLHIYELTKEFHFLDCGANRVGGYTLIHAEVFGLYLENPEAEGDAVIRVVVIV